MTPLRLDELRQHTDMLRLRSGKSLAVRFVEPDDAEALQGYFRALSVRSRYNRFLGAMSELPQTELETCRAGLKPVTGFTDDGLHAVDRRDRDHAEAVAFTGMDEMIKLSGR